MHLHSVSCPNPDCGDILPFAAVACHGCGCQNVGYPNVRHANDPAEVGALDSRVRAALRKAKRRGSETSLKEFSDAVGGSNAVAVMSPADLRQTLGKKNNKLWISYYRQKHAGGRVSERNKWDLNRGSNDEKVAPEYYSELHYAALSLTARGSAWYGGCHVLLDSSRIASRTSLFWENPFNFLKRRRIKPDQLVPPGYRASWERRSDLAIAKLHDRVLPGHPPEGFRDVLLDPAHQTANADFIEVHIYGPVSPTAFARVSVDLSLLDDDDLLDWTSVKRQLENNAIPVEEGPNA